VALSAVSIVTGRPHRHQTRPVESYLASRSNPGPGFSATGARANRSALDQLSASACSPHLARNRRPSSMHCRHRSTSTRAAASVGGGRRFVDSAAPSPGSRQSEPSSLCRQDRPRLPYRPHSARPVQARARTHGIPGEQRSARWGCRGATSRPLHRTARRLVPAGYLYLGKRVVTRLQR
jgi:hypothetical protein